MKKILILFIIVLLTFILMGFSINSNKFICVEDGSLYTYDGPTLHSNIYKKGYVYEIKWYNWYSTNVKTIIEEVRNGEI